jgi:hypothetical protein
MVVHNKAKEGFYQKIDNNIMAGVNAGVKTWNRTTGRTRADLANLMAYASNISITASMFFICSREYRPLVMMVGGILLFHTSLISGPKNKELDEKESGSLREGTYSLEAEAEKNLMRLTAPATVASAPLAYAFSFMPPFFIDGGASLPHMVFAESTVAFGASEYIMRADCVTPNGGAFAKSIEALKRAIRELHPVPVSVLRSASRS